MSGGRVRLAAGTLFGAINTLLEKEWIQALPEIRDSRRKEYTITEKGREILQAELIRLQELVENGNQILGGTDR